MSVGFVRRLPENQFSIIAGNLSKWGLRSFGLRKTGCAFVHLLNVFLNASALGERGKEESSCQDRL